MANGLSDHRSSLIAIQLPLMLNLQGVKGNQNWSLFWFELAGVSWSEFAAGTPRAQSSHRQLSNPRESSPARPLSCADKAYQPGAEYI